MEDNHFSHYEKNIVVGDFAIACVRYRNDMRPELPLCAMAFYHPGKYRTDFQFAIDYVKPDNSGALLFGSESFSVPTFLYRRENGELDWFAGRNEDMPKLSFRISQDWTKFTLYWDNTETNGEKAFWEFGRLFAYGILNRDACVLHGVLMEHQGHGILVCAPAGTGKTTHTRMWRDRENALIINGDRCLCRRTGGIWYAYGMPWAGSSGEYINRKVPITAIVSLRQDKQNSVRRMQPFESAIFLMQRIFAPVWPGELQSKAFDITDVLAGTIPMLELSCRPDYEAVDVLKEAIEKLGETG